MKLKTELYCVGRGPHRIFVGIPNDVLENILERLSPADVQQAGKAVKAIRFREAYRRHDLEDVLRTVDSFSDAVKLIASHGPDFRLVSNAKLKLPWASGSTGPEALAVLIYGLSAARRMEKLFIAGGFIPSASLHFQELKSQWSMLREVDIKLTFFHSPINPLTRFIAALPPSLSKLALSF